MILLDISKRQPAKIILKSCEVFCKGMFFPALFQIGTFDVVRLSVNLQSSRILSGLESKCIPLLFRIEI